MVQSPKTATQTVNSLALSYEASTLNDAKLPAKKLKGSTTYHLIPYATEQVINLTVSGI